LRVSKDLTRRLQGLVSRCARQNRYGGRLLLRHPRTADSLMLVRLARPIGY
jgi:hypothetical protein